jgi:excisionase family DNA binding protein
MRNEERLLTPAEVERMLGIKRCTLYVWAARGVLPAIRLTKTLGGRRGLIRFRREDVTNWIMERAQSHEPEAR